MDVYDKCEFVIYFYPLSTSSSELTIVLDLTSSIS